MKKQTITYRWTEKNLSPQESAILHTLFSKDALLVYLAVSGWPDSMYLAQLVFDTFFTNGLDMSRIVILYADHRTVYMPSLFDSLCSYFSPLTVVGCSFVAWWKGTETSWRKQRQIFFSSHLQRTGGILCTGHNLTDHIETTLLNLQRGTQRRGLLNMQYQETTSCTSKANEIVSYTHLRPLLVYTKQTILQWCDQYMIPYRIDSSNGDTRATQRNALRKKYQTTHLPPKTISQRLKFYTRLASTVSSNYPTPQKTTFPVTHFPPWFSVPVPQSRHELSCLLSRQKLYNWVTRAFLDELFQFLTTATTGYRYVRGWWICLAFKKVYFFPATSKTPFWKTPSETSLSVPPTSAARLPQPWDRYHGKLFSKRLSKKGVPFFVRPFVPVVAKWKEIIQFELMKGFLG
jgi:tRNA(Ile)-lysidine synthetase-like protein